MVGFLNSDLRHKFLAISKELAKIKLETLTDSFSKIVSGSPEDSPTCGARFPLCTTCASPDA